MVDVAQYAVDLQLRHRPAEQVDVERVHLHTEQLRVHATADDAAGVTAEVALLEWLRDRVTVSLDPAEVAQIDARMRDLRTASDTGNLAAAADHAARLAATLRNLTP